MPAQPAEVSLEIDGTRVIVRRSPRRRRSMSARFEGETIVVLTPAHLSARAEREAVGDLVSKVLAKRGSARNDADLTRRAMELTRRYIPGAPEPTSVRWVSNMTTRWASCSPGQGTIRLSDKLVGMPSYVIDSVLVHELAHLVERGHGPAFQRVVRGFPKQDLAEAYLAGASFGSRYPGGLPSEGFDSDDQAP